MKPGPTAVEAAREDECTLLQRAAAGEQSAFADLVHRYRSPVFSYLTRCGVDSADRDDLFQEIFIRIHKSAPSYDAERPVHPWIFTIVANRVRTYFRKKRIRNLVGAIPGTSHNIPSSRPDAERSAAAKQTLNWLEKRLQTLPLARREVLVLVCIENLPLKEVATTLGIPLGTVKTHLRRARLALAEELAERNTIEVSS